ncbi:arginine N-methyltransferase type II putative (PRMT5) [Leptomonas pyrrhocoris]|uniref:Arginine N-methyltransferase type II putative (PRMT5) n=1 Tax=Leptomonas pyrrhocoris TaxID=157538 RepID=A0A0N0DU37_LEPPY|nr:arginine N-methyltransferase type II putative (PRMT5) [Leptomonas pyrrhocoris]KPA78334.1 arginine N-methyltransferase type II putative (PRMT5) [Leptomonas pyrrhocoris]|eukprot:XP_015656773.1 arginine N-methyltransferase type II putative (PRMT5) [Leptomonas pyrrhocoris]
MSLDGGGISNGSGARDTASAVEEDYCLYGRERLQRQWATTGVFQPGALRLYGITGEPQLLRSIKQTRMLGALFGTCFLGRLPNLAAPRPCASVVEDEPNKGGRTEAAPQTEMDRESAADGLPFYHLLFGPVQPTEFTSNAQLAQDAWHREVVSAWNVLQTPSEWCQAMNGVVTETNWSTREQRQRIREQLELASFMCLRAVQVPLPFYARELPWAAAVSDSDVDDQEEVVGAVTRAAPTATADNDAAARTAGEGRTTILSPDEDGQRNARLACLAADALLTYIRQGSDVKVWVRCDGCNPAHRYQMQRLRQAVLYGYTRHSTPDRKVVYEINPPCSVAGTGSGSPSPPLAAGPHPSTSDTVHTEAVSSLVTMLYFSSWHPRMLLPSEWFGEQVVCFECPSAPLLFACMAPHGVTPQQHRHYRPGGAAAASLNTSAALNSAVTGEEGDPLAAEGDEEHPRPGHHGDDDDDNNANDDGDFYPLHAPPPYNVSRRSSSARLPETDENEMDRSACSSAANGSRTDWGEELGIELQRTPDDASAAAAMTVAGPYGLSAMGSPFPSEQADAADTQLSDVQHRRYVYEMPEDLSPLSAARWAGGYPPFVSVLTFLVELMRRRALPLFDRGFFDQYPLMNYLYFKAVEEPTRDVFAPFEGQLQLPLQPLSHQLSSGVYEVFERDARKYRQYREAIYRYVRDWYEDGPARQHAFQNKEFFDRHGVMRAVPTPSSDERVLHLVLLGCGRGPLIDECLHAVSALGVRLRIFAMEKNRPAAAFTRMRWASEPEWAQLAYTFGHTLEVLVVDGRHIARAAQDGSVVLPPDFGLCDVVVSELLGSLGDNELSPECLESFHEQLLTLQDRRGLHRNAHLTCIPQQYTAWVAPLMSVSLEEAVSEAAGKGLTVALPHCPDRHAALYHSLLVTNLNRGVTLAAPQPCWSFTHDFAHDALRARASPDSAPSNGGCSGSSSTTAATAMNATSMERCAHLTFTVPPCGRCSGLAGYFSCVLYQSPTSPAVTISTAPMQRTADMYSWFPCTFTLEPTQQRELHEVEAAAKRKSGVVALHVDLARKTNAAQRRVWYEWSVCYGDAAEAPCETAAATVVVHNRDGWASSMLL